MIIVSERRTLLGRSRRHELSYDRRQSHCINEIDSSGHRGDAETIGTERWRTVGSYR